MMARSSELQRQLDFWAGIPLIWLIAAVRHKRSIPVSPTRIAVLSPSAIGDLILSSGVFLRARGAYPDASIHVFHAASNASAVPLIPVDVVSHLCDFTDFRRTLTEIRGGRFDLVIDLTPWPRLTALYAALSGAATVGFRTPAQYRHYAFDVSISHLHTQHEVENLSAIGQLIAPDAPYVVRIRSDFPIPQLPVDAKRVILFHIAPGGSRSREKSWPTSYWAELAGDLVAQGYSIGFTGIESDQDRVEKILTDLGLPAESIFSLCGKLTLAELVALLTKCRLCVTVDTATVHLASAVGIPTVALFGASKSARWGARSPLAVNVDAPHPDAGYINLGFERKRGALHIMPSLSVNVVRGAIESLLQRT